MQGNVLSFYLLSSEHSWILTTPIPNTINYVNYNLSIGMIVFSVSLFRCYCSLADVSRAISTNPPYSPSLVICIYIYLYLSLIIILQKTSKNRSWHHSNSLISEFFLFFWKHIELSCQYFEAQNLFVPCTIESNRDLSVNNHMLHLFTIYILIVKHIKRLIFYSYAEIYLMCIYVFVYL